MSYSSSLQIDVLPNGDTRYNFPNGDIVIVPCCTTAPSVPVISVNFSANVLNGASPLTVIFTNLSTVSNCTGTTYLWEYKLSSAGSWTAFTTSTATNPTQVLTGVGAWDIRLTVTCGGVSQSLTKTGYISTAVGKFISWAGSDAAAGTFGAPWKSFTFAMTQLAPGDTLYVLGDGGIFQERVTWNVPGTAGNPISIRAYAGTSWRMNSNGNTIPSGTSDPATAYPPYGTTVDSNFNGLFSIETNYINVQGLKILSSRGIGLKIEGVDATHVHHIDIQDCEITGANKNGFRCQYADDVTIDGLIVTGACAFAAFIRPTATLNHPSALSIKNGLRCTIRNFVSGRNWGEGVIWGDNQNGNAISAHQSYAYDGYIYDNMSPNYYVNNCQNIHSERIVCYTSATSLDPGGGSGFYVGCEYLDAADLNQIKNVTFTNCLGVRCGPNFRFAQGEAHGVTGLLPKIEGVKVHFCTFVEATTTSIIVHPSANFTSADPCSFKYNVIQQSLAGTTIASWTADPDFQKGYNNWSTLPTANARGTGDINAPCGLVAPLAVPVSGAIDVSRYVKTALAPGKNVVPTFVGFAPIDFFQAARTAPFSMGFDE